MVIFLIFIKNTVSQIDSLTYLPSILTILAPNSTPIVTSCFYRNLLSINYNKIQLFPTPFNFTFFYILK